MNDSNTWLRGAGFVSAAIACMGVAIAAHAQPASAPLSFDDARLPPQIRLAAARYLSHRIHIDGASEPDKLSLADLMRGRLATISADNGRLLGSADRSLVATYAIEEQAALERIEKGQRDRFQQLCANRSRQDTATLGAALADLEAQEDYELSSYYEQVLGSLSPRGRAAVRKYLRSEVAPATMKSKMNYRTLANDMPEQLVAQVERACTATPSAPTTTIEHQGESLQTIGVRPVQP